ncbi:hypothetical protein OAU36_05220 [Gammaproteobacteria bacterium]|nr:hypothetical protein [Gammaproteobacteria bacterium]
METGFPVPVSPTSISSSAGFRGAHPEDTYGSQMLSMSKALGDDRAVINVVSYINTLVK